MNTDKTLSAFEAARDHAHADWAAAADAYSRADLKDETTAWEFIAALGATHAAFERAKRALEMARWHATNNPRL